MKHYHIRPQDGKFTLSSSISLANGLFNSDNRKEFLAISQRWRKFCEGMTDQNNLAPLITILVDLKNPQNNMSLNELFDRYSESVYDDRWIVDALEQFGGEKGMALSEKFKDYLNDILGSSSPFISPKDVVKSALASGVTQGDVTSTPHNIGSIQNNTDGQGLGDGDGEGNEPPQ